MNTSIVRTAQKDVISLINSNKLMFGTGFGTGIFLLSVFEKIPDILNNAINHGTQINIQCGAFKFSMNDKGSTAQSN